jgi:hypothetical protein
MRTEAASIRHATISGSRADRVYSQRQTLTAFRQSRGTPLIGACERWQRDKPSSSDMPVIFLTIPVNHTASIRHRSSRILCSCRSGACS